MVLYCDIYCLFCILVLYHDTVINPDPGDRIVIGGFLQWATPYYQVSILKSLCFLAINYGFTSYYIPIDFGSFWMVHPLFSGRLCVFTTWQFPFFSLGDTHELQPFFV